MGGNGKVVQLTVADCCPPLRCGEGWPYEDEIRFPRSSISNDNNSEVSIQEYLCLFRPGITIVIDIRASIVNIDRARFAVAVAAFVVCRARVVIVDITARIDHHHDTVFIALVSMAAVQVHPT